MNKWAGTSGLRWVTLAGAVFLHTALGAAAAEDAAGTIGLQAVTFRFAHHTGTDDCPVVVTSILPTFLGKYAPTGERERLAKPESGDELAMLANNAPGRSDICSGVQGYLAARPDYPPLPAVKSKVSYGLNLDGTEDGRATPKTCPHPKFAGLNGESGIDNQLYRALGCTQGYRYEPRGLEDKVKSPFDYDPASRGNKPFVVGEQNYLFQITPKHGAKDGEVELEIFYGRNAVVMGGDGKPVPWTTQTVDPDPKFYHRVRGRLVDGKLTTEPFDFRIRRQDQAQIGVWAMRDARVVLDIQPDGSAKGLIAGYVPITDEFWFTPAGYLRNATAASSMECAGMYRALQEQADGYPDPETGQCTALSGALAVEFVPAFIVRPEAKEQTAAHRAAQTEKAMSYE